MRTPALLLVVCMAMLVSSGFAAEKNRLLGKPVTWEVWGEPEGALDPAPATPSSLQASLTEGEALETPNQRHHRLGLPIEASFPPEEYGEKIETPNQRRARLSLAPAAPVLETDEGPIDDESDERVASVR
jgi:hypothetical protein